MLAADKGALERELRVAMLNLQWKELQYLHTNFQNLATSSAVLVGFGFSALGISSSYHPEALTNHSSIWELDAQLWLSWELITEVATEALFQSAASFALAFNLLSLFISTISSMCGPGMALRGPEGSVQIAVKHMEQQLKRALRFFGRGVVAFIITLTMLGLRNLQDVGFIGGGITVLIGLWTFHAIWAYGADIAEKFHVSPDRAVRGTFVSRAGGTSAVWKNTEAERAQQQAQHRARGLWQRLLGRKRWRPQGHGITTPLWRLDKMIAFPYHDEAGKLRRLSEKISDVGMSPSQTQARNERGQMERLVMNAQGPVDPNARPFAAARAENNSGDGSMIGALHNMISDIFDPGYDDGGVARSGGGPAYDDRGGRGGQRLIPAHVDRS